MRRALMALMGTAAGTVLLVGANSRPLVEDMRQLPAVCVAFLLGLVRGVRL